ncbi:MAG TPA: hypothetical protein VGN89_05930 [Phenylobacterium sp.]|nr:hypothetical protein [Phenylobacterium sp.]
MRAPLRLWTVAAMTLTFGLAVGAASAAGLHEPLLRRLIADAVQGRIDYRTMTPQLADAIRAQAATAQSELTALGPLKSVTLEATDRAGAEFYRTDFENGALEWALAVNPQGLIANAKYRPLVIPAP